MALVGGGLIGRGLIGHCLIKQPMAEMFFLECGICRNWERQPKKGNFILSVALTWAWPQLGVAWLLMACLGLTTHIMFFLEDEICEFFVESGRDNRKSVI